MAVVVVWRELESPFLSGCQEYQLVYVASFLGLADSWAYKEVNLV